MQTRHPSRILSLGLFSAALLTICAGHARASEPKDRVICTDAPKSTWMSEAEARERFHASKYMLLRFKVSSENCHEFYAIEHDGTVVEAYVHPVTGDVLRSSRIPPPGLRPPEAPRPTTPGQ